MSNRLAQEQSLYLRKHAENPIDWWPWSEEALETARREDKPIFLSIGYSSCHWCTVMEGEAFSDEAIAQYMNTNFLPIKVDREERPDIDSIYMQSLQMMTGQGGWPLNVFLSPDDLVPFYGGTYFPVEPRYGRPGFLQVLQAIRQFYDGEKGKVQSVKEEILGRLQRGAIAQGSDNLDGELLHKGLDYSAGILTGRGMGPSFPMIPYAMAAVRAMRYSWSNARYDARETCQQRGLDLALGGIFDHVAGGFHRYTVDSTWTVPHFEKMLYDNGQIVEFLAELWAAEVQEPSFERAIALTVEWLRREMTAPAGYFYAAQDADSFVTPEDAEPEEGAFYIWRYAELQKILSAYELSELIRLFTVSEEGNFEGKNVLQRHTSQDFTQQPIEPILQKLFAARYGSSMLETFPPARNNQEAKTYPWSARIPAVTDTKMIVAWNSLMISGLARAASVLERPAYLELAARAANFILENQFQGGRFHRLNYDGQPSVLAQSEDYALFIKALLDLNQTTLGLDLVENQTDWLQRAIALQAEFDQHLWSEETGGYYNTDVSTGLVVQERSFEDNATPSANGVAIANLVRLALLAEDLTYLDRAERTLQSFSTAMTQAPQSCPSLFVALDWLRNHILIRTTPERISILTRQFLPSACYKVAENLSEGAVGLICQGLSCQEPALSDNQLLTQIEQSQTRG